MAKLTVAHTLFERIRNEHKELISKLQNLNGNVNLPELIDWLWNFVELNHHYKEETILFDFMYQNPRVCEGGPMCTFYFDQQILFPPLALAKKLTGVQPKPEHHQIKFINSGSPVRVPLNEHQAGKEILRYCRENYRENYREDNSKLSREQVLELLYAYEKIQVNHLEKEEGCFFHLCTNLLSLKEADDLLVQWDNFTTRLSDNKEP